MALSNGGSRSSGFGNRRNGFGSAQPQRSASRGLSQADEPEDESAAPAVERAAPTEAQAIEWCLLALEARAYTRAELLALLNRKSVPAEVSGPLLDRYAEVGLLDDEAFAADWVEQRHRTKGLAGRALAEELRRKGVTAEAAVEAVAAIDPETEAATARALVDRKLRTVAGLPDDVRVRRLVGMLARKGYGGHLAYQVVQAALAAEAELAELESLLG